jgi:hypothetical protein
MVFEQFLEQIGCGSWFWQQMALEEAGEENSYISF